MAIVLLTARVFAQSIKPVTVSVEANPKQPAVVRIKTIAVSGRVPLPGVLGDCAQALVVRDSNGNEVRTAGVTRVDQVCVLLLDGFPGSPLERVRPETPPVGTACFVGFGREPSVVEAVDHSDIIGQRMKIRGEYRFWRFGMPVFDAENRLCGIVNADSLVGDKTLWMTPIDHRAFADAQAEKPQNVDNHTMAVAWQCFANFGFDPDTDDTVTVQAGRLLAAWQDGVTRLPESLATQLATVCLSTDRNGTASIAVGAMAAKIPETVTYQTVLGYAIVVETKKVNEAAILAFSRAYELGKTTDLAVQFSEALRRGDRCEQAIAILKPHTADNAGSFRVWEQLCLCYSGIEDYVKASKAARTWRSLDSSAEAAFVPVETILLRGAVEEADTLLRDVGNEWRETARWYANHANVLLQRKDLNAATEACHRATVLDANSELVWRVAMRIASERDDDGRVADAAEQLARLHLHDARWIELAARACEKAGRADRFQLWFQQLKKISPEAASKLERELREEKR